MENTWIILLIIVSQLAWLWTLLAHLNNQECSPTDKICWTIVLCVLNVLGMILYFIGFPREKEENFSEEELKRSFNEGRR
ncbi:PLDc N-terminal domain-containing protein [Coraliomargarita sp. W4R53]